jgi:hypothetical protein
MMGFLPIAIALLVGFVLGVGFLLWFSNRPIETRELVASIREICVMPGGLYRHYFAAENQEEYWIELSKQLTKPYSDGKWVIVVEDDTDIVALYPKLD